MLAGREDLATPPGHARELADGIEDSTLVEVSRAAHLAVAEQPARVLGALRAHLASAGGRRRGGPDGRRRERAARPASVATRAERAPSWASRYAARCSATRTWTGRPPRATPFTAPFQDLITRYAWGEIWTRPGLDRRTRSCVTLTALVAGGHHDELAMHVRAALRNGLTHEEIQEVLLQSAIYCGVPAANTAFAIAARVLARGDRARGPGA